MCRPSDRGDPLRNGRRGPRGTPVIPCRAAAWAAAGSRPAMSVAWPAWLPRPEGHAAYREATYGLNLGSAHVSAGSFWGSERAT
jgi:hypothetical protein